MDKHQIEDEVEIDFKEVFFVLLHNWKKIIAVGILAGLIMLAYSMYIASPQYESTSKLYVLTKSTSVTSLADIQSGTNLTKDYQLIVSGRPVVESVIENLDLDMSYKEFCKNLRVENPADTRILYITYNDTDPEKAKDIVDNIADVAALFISEKMDQDPPTIIERGYSDGGMVSPNITKNVLLGVFFGALLVAIIVLLAYVFNDRIMTDTEIEKNLGLNNLAIVPFEEEQGSGKKNKTSKKQRKKF